MIILLLMIVLYVIHDHCLRQEASNVELEWLIVWQNNVHMLLLFPSPFSHWLVFPRQGPKHSGLCSVISRSSPLSEFTVYIVRRGFAYWGIGVRTGALTTGDHDEMARRQNSRSSGTNMRCTIVLSYYLSNPCHGRPSYPPGDSCCGATIPHTWLRFCTRLGRMVNYWISRSIEIG